MFIGYLDMKVAVDRVYGRTSLEKDLLIKLEVREF